MFLFVISLSCGLKAADKNAQKTTVAQLEAVIEAAQAAGASDDTIAQKIVGLTLAERLTERTLTQLLQKGYGPYTAQELRIQSDKSAFLEPPSTELPQYPKPRLEEQRVMIAHAINYTANFIHTLPDFICTRTTQRLDDDPLRSGKKVGRWQKLRVRDTLVQQLTFNHGKESAAFQMVNGRPYRGKRALNGLVTSGEFGNMLAMMLLGKSGLKAWWSHWEIIEGKRVAVFHYAVDRAHSQYAISYCCHLIRDSAGRIVPETVVAAFTGELFLEPMTGTIYRATWQTAHLPRDYPTKQSGTFVEYRSVDIGDKTYVCPVKSVTISDSVMYATAGTDTFPLHSINESRFTDYRKFNADATFLADGASRHTQAQKTMPPMQVMTPEVVAQPGMAFDPAANAEDDVVAAAATAPVGSDERRPTENPETASITSAFPLPLPPPFVSRPSDAPNERGGAPAMFHAHLTVVTIPVVVRDADGHPVGDLKKDDFALFDNGKKVNITQFAVERAEAREQDGRPGARKGETVASPDRYVSYVFDDLRLSASDLQQARKAAKQVLEKTADNQSRAAVFSTSGLVATHFTSDRETLEQAWKRIAPRAHTAMCPDISPYMADLILNQNDGAALAAAMSEMDDCQPVASSGGTPRGLTLPNTMQQNLGAELNSSVLRVRATAQRVLQENEVVNRREIGMLQAIMRRMAVLPGQRTIVLISPGFMTPDLSTAVNGMVDEAARNAVVVNAVDARGLYARAGYSAESKGMSDPAMLSRKQGYEAQEQGLQSNIMLQLAHGTGGTLFENSNDLRGGIERAAARPEVRYVLGFAPPQEKEDGSFHRIKVNVAGRRGLTVEARHGYLAPKHFDDPAEQAKYDLVAAAFSRESRSDLPTTVQTARTESGLR